MNLLVAGYQTTASKCAHRSITLVPDAYILATLTWALLELALHPDVQRKLREEILTFDEEPTYDQLSKDFPYLDAVLHEVFRLHPSSSTFPRMVKRSPQFIVSLLRLHFRQLRMMSFLSQNRCTPSRVALPTIFLYHGGRSSLFHPRL